MKSIILIFISLLSLNAFAGSTVFCDSIYDGSKLTIHIGFDQRVSSVRLEKDSASSQTFFAYFMNSFGETSTYSLSGTSDLLRTESTVENYGFGRAEIGRLNFDCN